MRLLCKEKDPIQRIIKDNLHAQAVRVPNEEVIPLTIIENKNGTTKKRGSLVNILFDKSSFDLSDKDFEKKYMSNLSGQKTNKASIDIGLKILEGFLQGFGFNISSGLSVEFSGISTISFSFENVYKVFIDNGLLGEKLQKQRIDKHNPSSAIYFGKSKSELVVIDSIITSNNFTVNIEDTDTTMTKFNIDKIKNLLQLGVDLKIEETDKTSIRFKREKALPFAFTCLKIDIDNEGRIIKLPNKSKLPQTFSLSEIEYEKYDLTPTFDLLEIE